MSIIIFVGPSISREKVLEIAPNANIQPPAKQGDIYLATLQKPQIIILIDGVFESVPAVWHKEILYAISLGIHVYGCSSMGALRAAELDTFGMVGVGDIFQSFLNSNYDTSSEDYHADDDEVALVHGPKELNYLSVSRAMVDLRYDLKSACEHHILTQEQANLIAQQLKKLWYPRRTQTQLCLFAEPILSKDAHKKLSVFLSQESLSLKEQDALALLSDIAKIDLTTLARKQVDYVLQENDAWHTLLNDVNKQQTVAARIDLPISLSKGQTALATKLRAQALKHAQELGIDFTPWIQPAFHNIAIKWQCVLPDGSVDFESVSRKIQAFSLSTTQFHQWVEREALLLAYGEQVQLQEEHYLDERLMHQGYI
ncbi:hypothetical protein CBF23_008995 [Marinomonas agarivorans]|nr:hypothetical protein CBF23_008995 [Marinomonas agarivorans]